MKQFLLSLLACVLGIGMVNAQTTAYCIPAYTTGTGSGDYINSVQLNTINNVTGANPAPYYTDYTATQSTQLIANGTYTLSVQIGTFGNQTIAAWIDYDNNFVFDPTEKLGEVTGVASNGFANITFTLPPTASGTLRLRVRDVYATTNMDPCTNANWGETEDYAIVAIPPIPDDAGITSVTLPASGCGLSASELITVTIKNFGTNTQTSIPVSFVVNGGTAVNETWTGSLASGASATYTFTATADFSAVGNYTVQASTALNNDTNTFNDASSSSTTHIVTVGSFPYLQDFEAGTGDWAAGGANSSWTWGTPTKSNIIGAASGTQAWVTEDTVSYNANENSYVLSPCFDFSSLVAPIFRAKVWWDSDDFNDGTALEVTTDGGATWSTVGQVGDPFNWYTGNVAALGSEGWTGGAPFGFPTNITGSGAWVNIKHKLDTLGGKPSVRFRFRFASNGFTQADGFAFDDVEIVESPAIDAAADSIVVNNGCGMTSSEVIGIVIKNEGTQPLYDVDVYYQINGGTPQGPELVTDTIQPGATFLYSFISTANLSAFGPYTITVWTSKTNDGDPANDTASTNINVLPTITAYPYLETFDLGNGSWTTYFTNGTPGTSWSWGNAVGNNILSNSPCWSMCDTTGAKSAPFYLNNERSWVEGPCFDMSSLVKPLFRARVWWDSENSWDGVVLQASTNGGATWQNVGQFNDPVNWYNDNTVNGLQNLGSGTGTNQDGWTGTQANNGSKGWVTIKHELNGLGGNSSVRLRFAFGSDPSVISGDGFAFDSVEVYDTPPFDAGVTAVYPPGNPCSIAGNDTIKAQVYNYGTQTFTLTAINYQIDNGTIVTENPNMTLAPGANAVYTFTTLTNALITAGSHQVVAWTSLTADGDTTNDRDTVTYVNLGANGMTGVYTIDGNQPTAGTNYASFNDAVNDLKLRGLCGPVVFQVASDTFPEQVTLTPIINSSAVNTITFDGMTNNPLLTFAPSTSADRHIFRIDSADNVIIKNLRIVVDAGATYGYPVHLTNGAENIHILDNYIQTDTTSTSTFFSGIVQSGSYTSATSTLNPSGTNNEISGNTINGGYYAISAVANALTPSFNTEVTNNTIYNNYFYGLYLNNQKGVMANGNKVTPRAGTNTAYGMFLTGDDSAQVWNNQVYGARTYGIYLTNCSGSATAATAVVNNMVSDSIPFNTAFNGGIFVTNTSDIAVYHNSVWSRGATAVGINIRSGFGTTPTNVAVVNNSIATTGTDAGSTTQYAALYIEDSTNIVAANYNNVYSDNTNNYVYVGNSGILYANTAFIGGSGFNANSKDGNPGYFTKNNLHSLSAQLANSGDNSIAIATDIDGDTRPATGATNVCIGADEFTPPPFEAGVFNMTAPNSSCGLTAAEDITFEVQNNGLNTITTMDFVYSTNGGASTTYTFNGSIASGQKATITIPGAVNLATPGAYTIKVIGALAGDPLALNDTITKTVVSVPTITTFPYIQGFENGAEGWYAESLSGSSGNSWELGTPAKTIINSAASGVNAWITGLTAPYLNSEKSAVNSPCFDFSSMIAPKIEMAVNWTSEFSWDGMILQSSIDGGLTWQNVGAFGDPNNWYNDNSVNGLQGVGSGTGPAQDGWTGVNANSSGGWKIAKHDLTGLGGQASVRLRVAFGSDPSVISGDGVAFDDVFIFDTPQNDVGVVSIDAPGSYTCGDSSMQVIVTVKNYGLAAQTSFPVTVDYTGTATGSLTATYTGTLAPNATASVVVGTLNTYAGGTYNFTAYTQLAGDGLANNDTADVAGILINAIPSVSVLNANVSKCDTGSVSFTATSSVANATFNWFTSASGGTPVFSGATFTTPSLAVGNYTYYVQSSTTTSATVGALDNTIGTGGQQISSSNYLIFTTTQAITIDSVTVYPSTTTGNVIVNLRDNTGTTVATASYAIPATYTVAGDPLRIPVGIAVPVGTDWELTGDAGMSLYRNSSGPVYPYTALGVSITNSSAGNSFYYYFYNWKISTPGCTSTIDSVKATINAGLSVSLGPDQSICDIATVTATVNGGVPQLNYAWNNGFTSATQQVSTGQYSVVVTDGNGCQGADTVNIVSNPKPIVNLPATSSGCGNDTLDAGNVGSSFVWQSGGSAVGSNQFLIASQSGNYSVVVTNAFGCTATDTVAVTVLPLPVVSLGSNQSTCSAVTLDAGNAGSTYLWNTNATTQTISAATSGLYSVTVTNTDGCQGSGSVTITVVAPPVKAFAKTDTTTCGAITLSALNPGMTYAWSTGATTQTVSAAQSGQYSVTVTNNIGCKTSDSINVTINVAPTAGFTYTGAQSPKFAFTNTSTGSLTNASYKWEVYLQGAPTPDTTASTKDFSYTFTNSSFYDIILTVTNACGIDTFKLTREIDVAIDNNALARSISIYPNPTDGAFFVNVANLDEEVTMSIYDVNGKVVMQRVITRFDMGAEQRVDLSTEAKGVYMARFSTSNGASFTRQVVVK